MFRIDKTSAHLWGIAASRTLGMFRARVTKHWRLAVAVGIGSLLCAGSITKAQDTEPARPRGHRQGGGPANVFHLTVPSHPFDLILARPEANQTTLSALAYQEMEASIAWGTAPQSCDQRSPVQQMKAGSPIAFIMRPLQPNTQYFYRFRSRLTGGSDFTESPTYSFHTARSPGNAFTFTMTADVHLDEHTSSEVYLRSLGNIHAERPDFHIDLGNLFMTDKHATRDEARQQYFAQRFYLGQIGTSVPVMLALGTHDGESSRYDDGSADCLAVWSNLLRTQLFPNPFPDGFYSGNNTPKPHRQLLQNYYAWEWGDALFVVLDPFGDSSRERGTQDGWSWSLGLPQYRWLKDTLQRSRARFKFVFIHNLLSGDQASRGGVEIAPFNEWGGKNRDGSEGFLEHRPGWEMPIHQLLMRNHVAVVFRAHDNFFARQELDGILYEMVPQPSFAGNDRIRDLQNYGYKKGVFLGNTGHVRVTVSAGQVKVDYVRTRLPQDEQEGHANGEVADSFIIHPESGDN